METPNFMVFLFEQMDLQDRTDVAKMLRTLKINNQSWKDAGYNNNGTFQWYDDRPVHLAFEKIPYKNAILMIKLAFGNKANLGSWDGTYGGTTLIHHGTVSQYVLMREPRREWEWVPWKLNPYATDKGLEAQRLVELLGDVPQLIIQLRGYKLWAGANRNVKNTRNNIVIKGHTIKGPIVITKDHTVLDLRTKVQELIRPGGIDAMDPMFDELERIKVRYYTKENR